MSRRTRSKNKSDPHRAEQIRSMLQNEKETRDLLENTNRLAKDLSHWAHYDKLQGERVAVTTPLLAEIKDLLKRCLDMRGKCVLVESDLNTESQRLQAELDTLRGRVPEPDPIDDIEPLLEKLPPKQANALRFIMELGKKRVLRTSVEETKELTDSFAELLKTFEKKIISYKEALNDIHMIFQKKIERGWITESQLPPYKPVFQNSSQEVEAHLIEHRHYLANWITSCESLKDIGKLKSEIIQYKSSS